MSFLDDGHAFATSSWDILTGAVKPAASVLLYDDNGAHPGMTAAEFIAGAGSELEVVTPERMLAPDIGGTSYPAYFRALALADNTGFSIGRHCPVCPVAAGCIQHQRDQQ